MKVYITYNNNTFKTLLKGLLDTINVPYLLHGVNEIEFTKPIDSKTKTALVACLNNYHINVQEDQKIALVERIKSTIDDMLNDNESLHMNSSDYLADKLNYSYTHLSNLFSEATHTSIENFIILRKVDKVKTLLLHTDYSLTEIAFKLHYSSVAHLSGQFKKTTGLTPSAFQRIIENRKLKIN